MSNSEMPKQMLKRHLTAIESVKCITAYSVQMYPSDHGAIFHILSFTLVQFSIFIYLFYLRYMSIFPLGDSVK